MQYKKFYSLLTQQDTIVSLNYDLLSEIFLWNLNKWSFLDGYSDGVPFPPEEFGIKEYPHNKKQISDIKIYKVHGSLNWIVYKGEKFLVLLT